MGLSFVLACAVLFASLGVVLSPLLTSTACALEDPGERLDEIGISPELGTQVDLSLPFTTAEGKSVTLGELFASSERPAIIIPMYFRCPRLCGLLMSGVVDMLKNLTLKVGGDFQVVVFSFSATETAAEAAGAKQRYADMMELSAEQRSNFHFLIGEAPSIAQLTQQIGFKYFPDGVDFAHSAGLILVTPTGRVSQYFTGIEFDPFDMRLALVEASEGKIGTALDHVMLYCFRFDPLRGKYTWIMTSALRIAGAVTLLFLGGLIGGMVLRERRKKARARGHGPIGDSKDETSDGTLSNHVA